MKKKKNKDKKASNVNTSLTTTPNTPTQSTSGASSVPINVQIQQQFEALQPASGANTAPSTNQNTQPQISTPQIVHLPSQAALSNSNNNGNSSPAFKSLFRNLRVGSLKYQSSETKPTQQNNQTTPVNRLDHLFISIQLCFRK